MTQPGDLSKLVPGFDFLQSLMKTGGVGLPGIGQWIAPTLEPAELQKRIDELRTVQFWLDQNSKLLGTSIQALEVQRMTLATLKGMNLQMADLSEALKVGMPSSAGAAGAAASKASEPSAAAGAGPGSSAGKSARQAGSIKSASANAAPAIDPMQWWGALTQQFTELATKALKDGSAEMARNLAPAAAKQGSAGDASSIERAMSMSAKAAEPAATPAARTGGAATRTAPSRAAPRRPASSAAAPGAAASTTRRRKA